MAIVTLSNPEKAKEAFTDILKKNPVVICMYYWTQCGHCMDFAPLWKKVISKYGKSLTIVNIEFEAMKKLSPKYQISAFPMIIVYKNKNRHMEYTNSRTEKELHAFLKLFVSDEKSKKK